MSLCAYRDINVSEYFEIRRRYEHVKAHQPAYEARSGEFDEKQTN